MGCASKILISAKIRLQRDTREGRRDFLIGLGLSHFFNIRIRGLLGGDQLNINGKNPYNNKARCCSAFPGRENTDKI